MTKNFPIYNSAYLRSSPLIRTIVGTLFLLFLLTPLKTEATEIHSVANTAYSANTNPFKNGQCTWFAWGRVLDKTGIKINFSRNWGRHAVNWYTLVLNLPRGTTPQKDAIMVISGRNYGHVAIVEEVGKDYMIISEANWNREEADYSEGTPNQYRTITTSLDNPLQQMGLADDYSILGYIYPSR